jgi:hypothetical protein
VVAENWVKKQRFDGEAIEVLGPAYEDGKPTGEGIGQWQHKLDSRKEILTYLRSGERYWYGKEGFGSERRKNPA